MIHTFQPSGTRTKWLCLALLALWSAAAADERDERGEDGGTRYIAAYSAYANSEHVWVSGRLLGDVPPGAPASDDNWWDNLRATFRRWESDELPGELVELTYADSSRVVLTDEEGYYSAVFEVGMDSPRADAVVATHRRGEEDKVTGTHPIYSPAANARFMLISDVDDTVLHTSNTKLLTSAWLTFFRNARTREPLEGVADLYQSLARAGPVFYVSNSAWNLHDLLSEFLDRNDLPEGPLLLRDMGLGRRSDHKMLTLRHLMESYPELPAILIGDSGQDDTRVYAQIAADYPGRVIAIYIRDVDPGQDSEYDEALNSVIAVSERVGSHFLRVRDSGEIGRHLVEIGVLSDVDWNQSNATGRSESTSARP